MRCRSGWRNLCSVLSDKLLAREALSFNHQYIGTEYLLLGLLREQEGLAALALEKLGVALDSVRAAVEEKIGR